MPPQDATAAVPALPRPGGRRRSSTRAFLTAARRAAVLLAAGLLAGAFAPRSAQAQGADERGHPWVENYSANTFGDWRGDVQVAGRQNWSVTQGPGGIIYVANQGGLLSYDGTRWSTLPVGASQDVGSRSRSVFSVRRLPEGHPDAGRILVGADGTFGVLRPDSLGRLAYVSLLSHLPPGRRKRVGAVRKTSATSRAAYFLTARRLFRWRGDSLHAWTAADLSVPPGARASPPAARAFLASFVVRDTLYVQVRGAGLFRAGPGGGLRLVPGGTRFATSRIYALMPYGSAGSDSLLVGTRAEGFFSYDGTEAHALDWPVEPWLAEHQLTHGTRLPGGTYALATRRGGLLHTSARGERLHVLDTQTGLHDNKVHYVFVDRAGSLWLALGDGLARVDASAPFTYYDASLGLGAGVEALARHEGVLYACTRNGLHRLASPPGTFAHFEPVPAASEACTSLASTPQGLLVATHDGVVVYRRGRGSYPVGNRGTAPSPGPSEAQVVLRGGPGVAYVGYADGGVRRLRAQGGRWDPDPAFPAGALGLQDLNVQALAQAAEGTLWAAGPGGVARLAAPASRAPAVTRYGAAEGLPVFPGLKVFALGGRVYFSTRQGLHRFDEGPSGKARFVPDSTFGARWAQPGAYVTHLVEKADGSVWGRAMETTRSGRRVITSLHRGPGGEMRNARPLVPFRDVLRGPFYVEGKVVWLGSRGLAPLTRLDFSSILQLPATPAGPASKASNMDARAVPQIRRVTVGARDSLVYGGPAAEAPVRFASGRSALRVEYALPRFVLVATPVEYRTRLGAGARWSAWSRQAEVTYARLAPGRYQFQVQARLPGEAPTGVATLPFRVVPPWYRAPWALALWGLLGLGLLAALGAAGVRWRTRRLERHRETLEAQIAERTEALRTEKQKTEKQAERLVEIDHLKSRFFTNVSHEFRTPLTLTIGPLEDLQASQAASLSVVAREKVNLALRNSRRLLRLIGQLLDVAKLEVGALRLDAHRADLAAFVRGLARSFAPLAERRRVRFTVEAPEEPLPVRFDEDKLEQVLTNLLSNAFKFTPEGGAIHASVFRSGDGSLADAPDDDALDEALVTIRDSGPGIPAEEQPHLFERFYQAEETHSEVQPGTGIGLSLAKDLAELHGGTITVESEVGVGTTFTVRLPRGVPRSVPRSGEAPAPGEAPPTTTTLLAPGGAHHRSSSDPDRIGSLGADSSGDGQNKTPPLLEKTEPLEETDRTTLLIADDNAEIRAYVRSHFEDRYRVLEAADGRAALQTARAALPDLIISDVMMPHLDGFALVEALRADRETDFLPVILLTARATEEDKLEGLSEGADAYLTKPFNVRELQARVENLIASRRRLKERLSALLTASVTLPGAAEDLVPSEEAYLERVRATVEAHLSDEDFGVEQLAAALEQSRSTLYRRLRDLREQAPSAFIREVRLERAAALLREQRGTVSEVAYAVGFKSISHFSQAFRQAYDVTPSAYADEVPQP